MAVSTLECRRFPTREEWFFVEKAIGLPTSCWSRPRRRSRVEAEAGFQTKRGAAAPLEGKAFSRKERQGAKKARKENGGLFFCGLSLRLGVFARQFVL